MRLIPALLLLVTLPASAGDVLFLSEPDAELRARLLSQEGGDVVTAGDLTTTDAWTDADDQAFTSLAASLTDARTYETRLDGELVIMQQLALPIEKITAIRGEEDRRALFAALAYQGFAVDRFFGDDISSDERAADFRATVDGRTLPSPWGDAVAIAPDSPVTPYEIADATVRARYEEVRAHVRTALPALLVPELPNGVDLYIDGHPTEVGAAGTVKLAPGLHYAHAQLDGVILERWTVTLSPAERADLQLRHDPAEVSDWLATFASSPAAPPASIGKNITTRGGLLVVDPAAKAAYRVSGGGEPVATPLAGPPKEPSDSDADDGLSIDVALGGGWLGSQDFYYQDPTAAEATAATVNAGTVGLAAGLAYDMGLFRAVGGVDVMLPLGAAHAARYGSSNLRLRPTPFVGAGIRPIQAVVGYTLPYHLTFGARLAVPITSGLEIRGSAMAGPPPKRTRSDDTIWTGHSLGAAWLGIGWRLGT